MPRLVLPAAFLFLGPRARCLPSPLGLLERIDANEPQSPGLLVAAMSFVHSTSYDSHLCTPFAVPQDVR